MTCGCASGTAYRRTDGASYNRSGDCAGCSFLFDGCTASRRRHAQCNEGDDTDHCRFAHGSDPAVLGVWGSPPFQRFPHLIVPIPQAETQIEGFPQICGGERRFVCALANNRSDTDGMIFLAILV